MSDTASTLPPLTAKDFATDQEVRWCPGWFLWSRYTASAMYFRVSML